MATKHRRSLKPEGEAKEGFASTTDGTVTKFASAQDVTAAANCLKTPLTRPSKKSQDSELDPKTGGKKTQIKGDEESKKEKSQKTKRKQRMFKAKKLVLNVSQTKYNVVRYVAKRMFKMRLSGAPYMADY